MEAEESLSWTRRNRRTTTTSQVNYQDPESDDDSESEAEESTKEEPKIIPPPPLPCMKLRLFLLDPDQSFVASEFSLVRISISSDHAFAAQQLVQVQSCPLPLQHSRLLQ